MADNLGGTAVIPSLVVLQGTVFLFSIAAINYTILSGGKKCQNLQWLKLSVLPR